MWVPLLLLNFVSFEIFPFFKSISTRQFKLKFSDAIVAATHCGCVHHIGIAPTLIYNHFSNCIWSTKENELLQSWGIFDILKINLIKLIFLPEIAIHIYESDLHASKLVDWATILPDVMPNLGYFYNN